MKINIKKNILIFFEIVGSYWERYPALYVGFFISLGLASAFNLLYIVLALPFIKYKNLFTSICILLISALYFAMTFPKPPEHSTYGSGVFQVYLIKPHSSPFTSGLVYEGVLKKFYTNNRTFRCLPCRIYMNQTKNRPLINQDFFINKGFLEEVSPYHFVFKPDKKSVWIPMKKRIFFAEKRFLLKQKVRNILLNKWYKNKRTLSFMEGLITGETTNRLLLFQFNILGISHLLSISGFHFALLCSFLLYLFQPFMPIKIARTCALFFLLFYFFYLGNSPPVNRAWIGISLYLIGSLLNARPSALNMLGVAFLSALLTNPYSLFQVGFQLSYAATLGILLFYPYFQDKIHLLLPKRTFETILAFKLLDKWGYLIAAYIRNTLALSAAVLTFLLPLILFHFHRFPLISLAYNLFFPALFSALIPLFLIALIFPPLHIIAGFYAHFLLDLVEFAPKKLMFYLTVPEFSVTTLLVILTLVFSLGIKVWGEKERLLLK